MNTPVLMYVALLVGQSSALWSYYLESFCCGYTKWIDMYVTKSVRLRLTDYYRYDSVMNCSVTFSTSSPYQLMYFFRSFDVRCPHDFLEVHDGPFLSSPYASGFYGGQCGSYFSQPAYTTSNSALTLWFHSGSSITGKGFDLIITSYHTGFCKSSEYSCKNGRCVDNDLACNGFNPCGDHSDCPLTVGAIVGIAVGSACFAIIIVVIVCVVVRRRRRYVSVLGMTYQNEAVVSSDYEYDQSGPAPGQYQSLFPPYNGNAPYQQDTKLP